MRWGAGVDGSNIDFVLGSSLVEGPKVNASFQHVFQHIFQHGIVQLNLLGF